MLIKRIQFIIFIFVTTITPIYPQLVLNDNATFTQRGLSVLVFNNHYPEGHQGGVEIILHDERIATNGDLRLEPTPGQWDPLPTIKDPVTDRKNKSIQVSGEYSDLDISYTIRVKAKDEHILISVDLAQALPLQWVGKVGFNLELFPALYFGKTWHMDASSGIFPRQLNSAAQLNRSKNITIAPLAVGQRLSIAPESPLQHLLIESRQSELALYDGREPDNNGWFIIRSLVPAGATENAIEWIISPRVKKGWQRDPVILLSQVGYHPDQEKVAIIELDVYAEKLGTADIIQLLPDGRTKKVFSGVPKRWGRYLRYNYATLDFSSITESGIFYVNYDGIWSSPFRIDKNIYLKDVWQPTLETFFPVQMCHMEVRDRFRVWHGLCHMDDALQAPTSHEHFDGYRQGDKTESRYKAFEHIPDLNQGGWHDAGDYDLATGGQAQTVYTLALAFEAFNVTIDQTTVVQEDNFVALHQPDGQPDMLQQIEHGVRYLLAGYRSTGHAIIGIICPTLQQYVHLGDAMSMTDNQVYDASEDVLPAPNYRRGRMDDRWAFTNRDSGLEYRVVAALAAASQVLRKYNSDLASECQKTAETIWSFESRQNPVRHLAAYVPRNLFAEKVLAAVELFKLTKNARYRTALVELLPEIRESISATGWAVAQVFAELHDDTFDHDFFKAIRKYNEEIKKQNSENPFGVPYQPRIWGAGWSMQNYAMKQYFLHKAFPELFDRENIFRVIHFVLGCHPGSHTSFVSGVGSRSLTTAYGANRADYSYIPGGVASGTALIQPDFPELKEPWPFLWQQSEYVMNGAASYLFCILAANKLLSE
ncbi:glycoside hydrolase [candidate division KSB1 bacterium]|nr:glycoside hydrolase family 9 protein [candidate division KSB1 bacterium]RQW01260.1 MAG: glycoside hydrolase [candidate division KSB1 bacterium]